MKKMLMIFFDPIKVENVKLCKILYSKWYKLLFHLGVTTVAKHRLYQVGNQAKRHHSGWKPPPKKKNGALQAPSIGL